MDSTSVKRCHTCGKEKPLAHFAPKRRKSGPTKDCLECRNRHAAEVRVLFSGSILSTLLIALQKSRSLGVLRSLSNAASRLSPTKVSSKRTDSEAHLSPRAPRRTPPTPALFDPLRTPFPLRPVPPTRADEPATQQPPCPVDPQAHAVKRSAQHVAQFFRRGHNPEDSPSTVAARRQRVQIQRDHRVRRRAGDEDVSQTPPLAVLAQYVQCPAPSKSPGLLPLPSLHVQSPAPSQSPDILPLPSLHLGTPILQGPPLEGTELGVIEPEDYVSLLREEREFEYDDYNTASSLMLCSRPSSRASSRRSASQTNSPQPTLPLHPQRRRSRSPGLAIPVSQCLASEGTDLGVIEPDDFVSLLREERVFQYDDGDTASSLMLRSRPSSRASSGASSWRSTSHSNSSRLSLPLHPQPRRGPLPGSGGRPHLRAPRTGRASEVRPRASPPTTRSETPSQSQHGAREFGLQDPSFGGRLDEMAIRDKDNELLREFWTA
jgi:hypothetical protein